MGWARTFRGSCQGKKGAADFACQSQVQLWATSDGGKTWREIDTP
jgi:hypothetical protein